MTKISDLEALTRPLRTDLSSADEATTTNVFVPGLMGAGILMSAGILVSDGIKKLLPNSGTRRKIEVTRGVQNIVAGVAASAGVDIEGGNISRRRLRSVGFYIIAGISLVALAVAAVAQGVTEFNSEGVFEGNAISIAFGSIIGAVTGGLGLVFLVLGAVRRRRIPGITTLMETTAVGRLHPPPETRLDRARLLLPEFREEGATP